jgi:hypothetical protein
MIFPGTGPGLAGRQPTGNQPGTAEAATRAAHFPKNVRRVRRGSMGVGLWVETRLIASF